MGSLGDKFVVFDQKVKPERLFEQFSQMTPDDH